jgi:4,5-DOPA dioxygenase extradiol
MPEQTERMPAAFIGHGSPMNALELNRFSRAWRDFGLSILRPRAILAISAHWYVNVTAVTAMPRPRTIHDFYGFPRALFEVQYPAPGDPQLAEEVADLIEPTYVGLDPDSWGIDHGTWSVLVHMFPEAQIPVVQLSIDARLSFGEHVALGARLAPLCERGVLILGSGNLVHNLRAVQWNAPDFGFDWAHRFDEAAHAVLVDRPADIRVLEEHPDFNLAVPTADHFIPLLYFAGLASALGHPGQVLVRGCALGSISMTSYTAGTAPIALRNGLEPAASVPDPSVVPTEKTNL